MLESGALDHSAILTTQINPSLILIIDSFSEEKSNKTSSFFPGATLD